MTINLDIIIFIVFLLANLVVGLRYGRKVKTIQDYALGGRNFHTGAIVATIVATYASGSGFFITVSNTYSDGLYYLIASCAAALSFLVIAFFIVPRMGQFLGKTSIATMMGDLYGKEVLTVTAICGILENIGNIAVQFKVFGNLFSYFLGMDPTFALLLASSIVILYSSFGGIRAVTYTDILQFITFGAIMPLVGLLIWNQLHDSGIDIQQVFNQPKFNFSEVINVGNPKFWEMIPLILYFGLPVILPMEFQRISMGRNVAQVRKAMLIAAVFVIIIEVSIAWLPMLVQAVNPNLDPLKVFSFVLDNYTYSGLKGMIMIGIAAMAMSTADSRINVAAVLFANDLSKILKINVNELILSKIFAITLGIFAIYLALSKNDLLSITMVSASFYGPVVVVPMLLSIFGFRTSKVPVLIGMGVGFTISLVWNYFGINADGILIAMALNLVCLLGSHYILKQPGGWNKVQVVAVDDNHSEISRGKLSSFITFVKQFNFIEFCKKTAPKNELMYTGLGLYCIFYTFSTMYSTQVALLKENGRVILTFYQIMMCTGTIIAMYPIWPPRIKHEIIVQVAWNIVIFYMFAFFSCFFVMLSNFGQLQFAIFTLNIILTAILVGWKLAAGMMLVGFYLSMQFYKFYAGVETIDMTIGSPEFIFMYSLMLIGSALIIFIKPKQEQYALTEEKCDHLNDRIEVQELELRKALALKKEFIRNVTHEYNAPMTGILSMAETAYEGRGKFSKTELEDSIETIYKSALRLNNFDSNISTLAKLSKQGFELNKENIDLSTLVNERVEICRKLYEEDNDSKDREFIFNINKNLKVNADRYYLIQTIDNLIINALTYCKKGKIIIELEGKNGNEVVKFTIADDGIGIPPSELYDVFDEFKVSSKTQTTAGGRGVGLAVAKKVIEAHGGQIWAESDGKHGASFTFVL